MHIGIWMIHSDERERLEELFTKFGYHWADQVQPMTGMTAVNQAFDRSANTLVYKAATYLDAWTVVLDPELVMITNEEACRELSHDRGQPVFAMVCESASASYLFSYFNPDKQRAHWVSWSSDDPVLEDSGTPLPGEAGINWDHYSEPQLIQLMRNVTGVDYSRLTGEDWPYLVVGLGEEESAPAPQSACRKPWWRFW